MGGRILKLDELEVLVNKHGLESEPNFVFVRDVGNAGQRRVVVKRKDNNEEVEALVSGVKTGRNPFRDGNKAEDSDVINRVNKVGEESTPSFKFVELFSVPVPGKMVKGKEKTISERRVKIQNTETNEILECRLHSILRGTNPWQSKKDLRPIDVIVDECGDKGNPKFRFVKEAKSVNKNKRRAEVELLDGSERREIDITHLKAGKNPWGRRMPNNEVELRVNYLGKENNPKFKFVSTFDEGTTTRKDKKSIRMVIVERFDTNETKSMDLQNLLSGHNPWGISVRSEKDLEILTNKLGQECPDQYRFIREVESEKDGRWVEVENIKYKNRAIKAISELTKGTNPFGRKYTDQELADIINPIGMSYSNPFVFIRSMGQTKDKRSTLTEIMNLETGECHVSNLKRIKSGKNPWAKFLTLSEIEKRVNESGELANPKYKFIELFDRSNPLQVVIENCETQKRVNYEFRRAQKGSSPWTVIQDRHEVEVVQPKILKFLKKQGLEVEREVWISDDHRVDFVCTNKMGEKILIEAKSDKASISQRAARRQVKNYEESGKIMFQDKYKTIFLVSLEATYGIDLKTLKEELIQQNLL